MRVKITKCECGFAWYGDRIGEEFDVALLNSTSYYVIGSVNVINFEDCEIIQDLPQFTEESWTSFANAQEASKRNQLLEDMKNFKEFLNQSEEERKAVELLKGLGYDVKKVTVSQEPDDGWIPWSGGECPVDRDITVEIKRRNVTSTKDNASEFRWNWSGENDYGYDYDIIAYRVVKTP